MASLQTLSCPGSTLCRKSKRSWTPILIVSPFPTRISEYRKRGFRRWETLQSALEFSADISTAEASPGHSPSMPLVDNLIHWISLRFAVAAHTATPAEDSETELRQVRRFRADIVALRRGDLVARRIQLEQRRLALEETKNQQTLEKLFWEWTQRPDIRAQLFPQHDPDKMRTDVLRLLDHHLLGVRNQPNHATEPDPATLI